MQTNPEISHAGRVARFVAGGALDTLRDELEALRALSDASVVVLELGAAAGATDGFGWMERFELPVICTFEAQLGDAGADLALACDIRVCGADASITTPAVSSARLRRLLRDRGALDRAIRGEAFTAVEAFACGMVSNVTAAGDAAAEAMRLAGVMATRGPIALRLAKEAIWRGLAMPLEQGLRFETDLTLLLQTTKDRAEGVRAFMEKREPRFTGD